MMLNKDTRQAEPMHIAMSTLAWDRVGADSFPASKNGQNLPVYNDFPPFSHLPQKSPPRMDPSLSCVPSFDANTILGPVEIGVLIFYMLFGVSTTQCYIYFDRFPEDSRRLKVLTTFVWTCGLGQMICLGDVLYTSTVSNDTQPSLLCHLPSSLFVFLLLSGLSAACVYGFFSFRIYAFTKKAYIPGLIWFLAFLQLLRRIVVFALSLHTNSILRVACDVTIAVVMVVVLRSQRSHAYTKKTSALVDKLIVWAIETGVLTSVSSGLMLAFIVAMKQNFVWFSFYTISIALLPNSLMANLNSRATLRAMHEVSISLPSIPPAFSPGDGRQVGRPISGGGQVGFIKDGDGYQTSSVNIA
ncbi:hypothetical protein MSAN_01813700 [Mycena sanguinolenta]|uniref:DUF6534 domain-containing protein n=1 Tax=Mycena sanguinolenta TaxID=230812 RepID=A0A8H7CTD5_9AGAR|nr:hypothetical protein MSAN_01813700 [Mycena sanguinolenta]